MTQYLPYVKSYKRSWQTDETMIKNHLLPMFAEIKMNVLSAADIAVFMEHLKENKYSAGTINRALVLLRYGFNLAIKWKVPGVKFNPVNDIKLLKNDNKIERFLTSKETDILLAEVKKSNNTMLPFIVAFLLLTGARKREVLDAKWKDINFSQKTWKIPKTKSGKIRFIPLCPQCIKLLNKLLLLQKNNSFNTINSSVSNDYIFANPKTKKPYISIFTAWDKARKSAGLTNLRIHDLRHSFASFLVNAGRSLYEVQQLLGHADIKTTSRYAHLSNERLQEAVNLVGKNLDINNI